MKNFKLGAGESFPTISVPKLGGGTVTLGASADPSRWSMVVVYRGKHCPICTNYLQQLNELLPKFDELGVDVVAVSADSLERAEVQIESVKPSFDVAYDLSVDQMRELGLFVSQPRSEEESDRPFAEPGLFIINENNQVQVADISNAPFTRPSLDMVIRGIGFIRNPDNNYPIRGTL